MYTEDQGDDIKSEVASDIRDDIEDAIREFKENVNVLTLASYILVGG